MILSKYLNRNRANTILSTGIASMQADMAARSSVVRAIDGCMAQYPPHGMRTRFLTKRRIRIGFLTAVVASVFAHERWENEPIAQPMPITQAPANSPVRLWLMADSKIKVSSPNMASWWTDTLSKVIPFTVGSQFKKSSHSAQSNFETTYSFNLENATAFVAVNHSFYSAVNALLNRKWVPLQPGTVVTLPHTQTPWLINYGLGVDTIEHCNQVDIPEGSQIENYNWWDNNSTSYQTQLTPQDIVNGVLPVMADALHIRTWQAQATSHPDLAAHDAVEEMKLGLDALYVDAPSNHSHGEALLMLESGMADLEELSSHVSGKQALKIVKSLNDLAASFPDYKQLIKDDIKFNRGRLKFYLSRNSLTLKTVADAVNQETVLEDGAQQSPRALRYFRHLSQQLLFLSKSRILQDYDHRRIHDYKLAAAAEEYYNNYTTYLGKDGKDSIAWSAFTPDTDMILRPMIERVLTRLGMVKIEYALQAFSAAHGRLPNSLSRLIPQYLSSMPANLEISSHVDLSRYIVHRSIIYKREGNSYILYNLAPQPKFRNSGALDSRHQMKSVTNPDGTPYSAIMHYRGYSASSGVKG